MRLMIRAGACLLLALVSVVVFVPATSAAARVRVANQSGDAVVDPTYATTLTLRGSGFQSIKGGHGGIYVLFGTVTGDWRPSAHGDGSHLTVPDTQTRDNSGYARFVAFPGSDTAGSANGGTIHADGTWTTTITVPGAVFTTLDADQKRVRVDCRKVTCGVLTIGAHGVANRHNESFTPVRVANLYPEGGPRAEGSAVDGALAPVSSAPAAPAPAAGSAAIAGPATLEVDRASARPGHVLAFSATGLRPGSQVSATFEDGLAAAGPLTVGSNGQLAGLITLPGDLRTGTYQLRLVGDGELPSVRFAVVAPESVPIADATDERAVGPIAFAVAGAVALVVAVAVALVRRRRAR